VSFGASVKVQFQSLPTIHGYANINLTFTTISLAFLSCKQQTYDLRDTGGVSVVYWSEFLATDPEVQVRFPALPDFLVSSGSETASTQPLQYN
jgi:hypothetical protein